MQNLHGVIAEDPSGGQAGVREAGLNGSDNSQQVVLLQNQNFLVAYAREMIRDQAVRSQSLFADNATALSSQPR